MTELILNLFGTERLARLRRWRSPSALTLPRQWQDHFQRFGVRLVLLILLLLILVTAGTALFVGRILDQTLRDSMYRRGAAIALSAGIPAGYSLLADDRLALDNLTARLAADQPDLLYLAILDRHGIVRAHSRMTHLGEPFPAAAQTPAEAVIDGLAIHHTRVEGAEALEFRTPIRFADRAIGEVVMAMGTSGLERTLTAARARTLASAALALGLGLGGALLLTRRVLRPVRHLSEGVLRLQSTAEPIAVPVTGNDELGQLTLRFNQMARTIHTQRHHLEQYARDLETSYGDIVRVLAAALDARDNYTYGHSARVARLSLLIGRRLGLGEEELKELELGCLLHDIGKIRVPDALLNKQQALDAEEYRQVQEHPEYGSEILGLAQSLRKYIPLVRHHHEWHDGSGYPDRLAGDAIPVAARIIAIADAYDAMTTSRPYRPGRSRAEALAELRACAGRQFSPRMVTLLEEALEEYADVCDLPPGGRC